MSTEPTDDQLVALLVGFADALRQAGMSVGLTRLEALLASVTALSKTSLRNVYWAGRTTLCASPEDLEIFERCFEQFFLIAADLPSQPTAAKTLKLGHFTIADASDAADSKTQAETQNLSLASADEVLRHREFSAMTAAERDEIKKLIARLKPATPMRQARRLCSAKRGPVDVRQTVRAVLASGGDPVVLRYRKPKPRARKCVFLMDVSGSMKPYADPLLRFAFAAQRSNTRTTQVFTVGTRLTCLTPVWINTVPELALESAGKTIADWQGGTRLGQQLKYFLDHWGQRGMVRGAIAVIASDGWEEEGDAALLGEQMQRLRRLAYRVIWCNPHKSGPGYEPLARGMQAALPHIDEFVSGCTVDELAQLAATIANCGARSANVRVNSG
jgi:uncharacterized protein with von Willebrand factor type A (vWA) domain